MTDWLGPYKLNSIVTGDARELAKAIPDESVDLIFTDPVYQNIDDYRWLAETATRVLKPDRACLTWCGIGYLGDTLDALRNGGLNYRWLLVTRIVARVKYQRCDVGNNCWMCLLWMERGRAKGKRSSDLITVPYRESASEIPNKWIWGKPTGSIRKWLPVFSKTGEVVVDFFAGYGTIPVICKILGRNYLAFEIDPARAEPARERVRNTQPPLFVLSRPGQTRMELQNV